ncbi:MAG: hypothetical protein H7Z10_11975 [Gemmatimonadaceae bacterium]|nr:hypothetical protein [Acetobacteraceae bacterium]
MSGNGADITAVYGLLSEVAATGVRLDTAVVRLEAKVERTERTMATISELFELRQTVTHYRLSAMGY